MTTKKTQTNPFKKNKYEIRYNVINSLIAGALVFVGSLTGGFDWTGLGLALLASIVVCLTKFKEYWDGEKKEYQTKVFNFI